MKSKHLLLILTGLVIAVIINSCKKSGQSPIQALFTGGQWQLSSVQVTYYTGNSIDTSITISTPCMQDFIFNTNNTCTYSNFDCITQSTPAASWSLTPNQVYLQTNMVCKDTSAAGSSMPFSYAAIQNLGQFSLVLQTGDIQPNYSLTAKRKIIQWGFVRQKLNGAD
jgi:hypothetical protein